MLSGFIYTRAERYVDRTFHSNTVQSLDSIRFDSIRLDSIRLHSIRFDSITLHYITLHYIIRFDSIRLDSIRLDNFFSPNAAMRGKFGLLFPWKASSHSTALPSLSVCCVFLPVCSAFMLP